MAVIEPKQEAKSDPTQLIVGLSLLLVILAAIGGGLWWMLRAPKARTVTLSGEQAKQAPGVVDYNAAAANFPAPPPATQASDPGPTRLSLNLKNVLPQAAVAEVAKQAGVTIQTINSPQGVMAALTAPRIDVAGDGKTFWETLRDICKSGGLMPQVNYQNPKQIQLVPRPAEATIDYPTVSAGSCFLVLNNVVSTFDADPVALAKEPDRRLDVSLTLFAEPKLSVYRIGSVATIETAVDEKGNSLVKPRDPWEDRGGGRSSNWMADVNCRLKYPPNVGDRIAKLKGYASVIVAGKNQTIALKNPLTLKNADQNVDGQTLRVIGVRKLSPNQYDASFICSFDSLILRDWDDFQRVAKLVDRNGKEFQRGGGGYGMNGQKTLEFSVTFMGEGTSEPAELDVTLPTQVKELRVPFEFTDLPLPH